MDCDAGHVRQTSLDEHLQTRNFHPAVDAHDIFGKHVSHRPPLVGIAPVIQSTEKLGIGKTSPGFSTAAAIRHADQ